MSAVRAVLTAVGVGLGVAAVVAGGVAVQATGAPGARRQVPRPTYRVSYEVAHNPFVLAEIATPATPPPPVGLSKSSDGATVPGLAPSHAGLRVAGVFLGALPVAEIVAGNGSPRDYGIGDRIDNRTILDIDSAGVLLDDGSILVVSDATPQAYRYDMTTPTGASQLPTAVTPPPLPAPRTFSMPELPRYSPSAAPAQAPTPTHAVIIPVTAPTMIPYGGTK